MNNAVIVMVSKKSNGINSRTSEVKEFLKIIPKKSGVYIFKDSDGKIIYIGKAKNLYSRVRSYFQSRSKDFLYAKPHDFVEKVKSIDYVVTDNETEALILESSLIKKNKPKSTYSNKKNARHSRSFCWQLCY